MEPAWLVWARERGVTFGVSYNMDDEGNFDYLAGAR